MEYYKVKSNPLSGTSYREVYKQAHEFYKLIKQKTKRRPYIRSRYFRKEKIFFTYFWEHLQQKRYPDRIRRLKLFTCAIELIENSLKKPEVSNSKKEIYYRFFGICPNKQKFVVQIKSQSHKQLISIFPQK